MDAFMQHNILPDYMIGVSAGAAYGVCYASNQPGRNLKIIMNYRDDKRYMSVGNMIDRKNKCYCGLEFLYETVPNKLVPFDYDTFKSYQGEFYCVVTNVLTGKPEYIRYTGDDPTNQVLKATCALLCFFRIFISMIRLILMAGLATPYLLKELLKMAVTGLL